MFVLGKKADIYLLKALFLCLVCLGTAAQPAAAHHDITTSFEISPADECLRLYCFATIRLDALGELMLSVDYGTAQEVNISACPTADKCTSYQANLTDPAISEGPHILTVWTDHDAADEIPFIIVNKKYGKEVNDSMNVLALAVLAAIYLYLGLNARGETQKLLRLWFITITLAMSLIVTLLVKESVPRAGPAFDLSFWGLLVTMTVVFLYVLYNAMKALINSKKKTSDPLEKDLL